VNVQIHEAYQRTPGGAHGEQEQGKLLSVSEPHIPFGFRGRSYSSDCIQIYKSSRTRADLYPHPASDRKHVAALRHASGNLIIDFDHTGAEDREACQACTRR
jgi:hypothetical protein